MRHFWVSDRVWDRPGVAVMLTVTAVMLTVTAELLTAVAELLTAVAEPLMTER